MIYEQPAKDDLPARAYKVDVVFGLHCFTHGRKEDGATEAALSYGDNREVRIFDFVRYELSKRLPEIIEGLGRRKCFHTGKGNFFTIEIAQRDGCMVEYDVFFAASRSVTKGRIDLRVQSAYVRDKNHASNRPATKPIGFYVILFNTLHNKAITAPK